MANDNTHKKNEKTKIIIMVILITIIISVIAIIIAKNEDTEQDKQQDESYIQQMEDGISVNKSIKLNEAKLVNGLLISNIQFTEKGGMTTLLADITNKTEQKTELKKLKIILLDENDNEIATMTAFVNGIEPEAKTQLNASTTSNYIKAYNFKIIEE